MRLLSVKYVVIYQATSKYIFSINTQNNFNLTLNRYVFFVVR